MADEDVEESAEAAETEAEGEAALSPQADGSSADAALQGALAELSNSSLPADGAPAGGEGAAAPDGGATESAEQADGAADGEPAVRDEAQIEPDQAADPEPAAAAAGGGEDDASGALQPTAEDEEQAAGEESVVEAFRRLQNDYPQVWSQKHGCHGCLTTQVTALSAAAHALNSSRVYARTAGRRRRRRGFRWAGQRIRARPCRRRSHRFCGDGNGAHLIYARFAAYRALVHLLMRSWVWSTIR